MFRILTQSEIEKIKSDLVDLIESGNAPEDLIEHLREMGVSSPRQIPTDQYRPTIDRLPSGHWRMIADKWLNGIPGEPSSLDSVISKLDDILDRLDS